MKLLANDKSRRTAPRIDPFGTLEAAATGNKEDSYYRLYDLYHLLFGNSKRLSICTKRTFFKREKIHFIKERKP